MDVNDIINALNQVLDLGDQLDNAGGGVQGLTNGEHTTREVCRIELSQFLLYIADGCSVVNDTQAAILNIVLGDRYSNVLAYQVKELAKSISAPDLSKSMTLLAFKQADIALSHQGGEDSSSLTSVLLNIFEAYGQLMIAVNENPIAKSRYDRVISQFKAEMSFGNSGSINLGSSPFGSRTNSEFVIDNDVLTNYIGSGGDVVIPAGVSRIEDSAFESNGSIQSVVIPDGVESIGDSAFRHCDNMLSINLPEGIREIGPDAFSYCDGLTSIEIPSTVESIGKDAFCFCNSIKRIKIPASLTDIGDDAFMYCSDLETVIVYGSRRNRDILDAMKEHFHDDVKIVWEGDDKESSKKKSSTSKKGSSNKVNNSPNKHNRIGRDSDTVIGDRRIILRKDVLSASKYQGIHHVTGHSETVSPYGTWTIDVPAGFSYTMDPEFACKSMMGLGDPYPLQIQTTEDCDFSQSYDATLGLTIYPSNVVWVKIDDGGEDLRSSYSQSTLSSLRQNGINSYTVLIHTPDVLVQYDNSNRSEDIVTINFQIFCANVNEGSIGQIDIHGPHIEELEKKALEMLSSVGKVRQEFHINRYDPFAIASNVSLDFSSGETFELAPSVRLPVPKGFHATDNQSLTGGRSFIMVPEKYPFSNDPMQAMIGISGANGQVNMPDQYLFGMAFYRLLPQLTGVFIENSTSYFTRISDNCAAFFQENYEPDDETWALYRIMLFAGAKAFVLSMRINFGKTKAPFQASSIDARNIVYHWLSHITTHDALGTIVPFASPQVPDVFYEHLTLVSSGQYTTHRDADFVGQPILALMEKCGNANKEAYSLMRIDGDEYSLYEEALRLASVLRIDETPSNSPSDSEALIQRGMFADAKMFHMLRSLSWTLFCKADREGRTPVSYSYDSLKEIGEVLKTNYTNYSTDSFCSGLCSHYDWHVFYVSDEYINSQCRKTTDLRTLCGKENRGGNIIRISSSLSEREDRIGDIVVRCEETLVSLEALRNDLISLLPIMKIINEGLSKEKNRKKVIEAPLAEALTAWCALAVAAKEPFYSEEAVDTPEADAGLSKPLHRTDSKKASKANKPEKLPDSLITPNASKALKKMLPSERREVYERYLYHGDIEIEGKEFAFSGFVKSPKSISEEPIARRVLAAGGKIRSGVSTMIQYLVIKSMEEREESKLLKAVELIDKGNNIKMILMEDLESVLDRLGIDNESISKHESVSITNRQKEDVIRQQEEELKKDYVLDLHGETVIKEHQFGFGSIKALGKVIIPEGVVEIEEMAFCWNSTMEEVVFPSTLRKIGSMAFQKCSALSKIQLNDGLEEIGTSAFTECYNLMEIHLPDSLRTVDIHAFDSWDSNSREFVSVATLYLSGKLARYLQEHTPYPVLTAVNAKVVVIDGKQFLSIKDYMESYKKEQQRRREAEERERQEQLRRDAEERARQERVKQEQERQQREERERQAALERKKAERERINAEIFDLTNEMDNLKGLFAGMKRKKIQKRIDELNEQLRKL